MVSQKYPYRRILLKVIYTFLSVVTRAVGWPIFDLHQNWPMVALSTVLLREHFPLQFGSEMCQIEPAFGKANTFPIFVNYKGSSPKASNGIRPLG